MARMAWTTVLLLLLGAPLGLHAQGARVTAVQFPAWIERGGNSAPLTPGTSLVSGDRLLSGDGARIELKLPEGSTVKLGENAQFVIERLDQQGFFRAALHLIAGALRFTTEALRKPERRDVSIRVRNVTAGIRGTDLWGKSTDERDLVCLLEGRIAVASAGHPAVTLDHPLDFYVKPRDGEPQVGRVDPHQIETWSAQTDLAPEGGWARVGGPWRVIASKFERRDDALALNRRLRQRGYPARIADEEGQLFLVEVDGLAGETQARALMAALRGVPGVRIPSVRPMGGR